MKFFLSFSFLSFSFISLFHFAGSAQGSHVFSLSPGGSACLLCQKAKEAPYMLYTVYRFSSGFLPRLAPVPRNWTHLYGTMENTQLTTHRATSTGVTTMSTQPQPEVQSLTKMAEAPVQKPKRGFFETWVKPALLQAVKTGASVLTTYVIKDILIPALTSVLCKEQFEDKELASIYTLFHGVLQSDFVQLNPAMTTSFESWMISRGNLIVPMNVVVGELPLVYDARCLYHSGLTNYIQVYNGNAWVPESVAFADLTGFSVAPSTQVDFVSYEMSEFGRYLAGPMNNTSVLPALNVARGGFSGIVEIDTHMHLLKAIGGTLGTLNISMASILLRLFLYASRNYINSKAEVTEFIDGEILAFENAAQLNNNEAWPLSVNSSSISVDAYATTVGTFARIAAGIESPPSSVWLPNEWGVNIAVVPVTTSQCAHFSGYSLLWTLCHLEYPYVVPQLQCRFISATRSDQTGSDVRWFGPGSLVRVIGPRQVLFVILDTTQDNISVQLPGGVVVPQNSAAPVDIGPTLRTYAANPIPASDLVAVYQLWNTYFGSVRDVRSALTLLGDVSVCSRLVSAGRYINDLGASTNIYYYCDRNGAPPAFNLFGMVGTKAAPGLAQVYTERVSAGLVRAVKISDIRNGIVTHTLGSYSAIGEMLLVLKIFEAHKDERVKVANNFGSSPAVWIHTADVIGILLNCAVSKFCAVNGITMSRMYPANGVSQSILNIVRPLLQHFYAQFTYSDVNPQYAAVGFNNYNPTVGLNSDIVLGSYLLPATMVNVGAGDPRYNQGRVGFQVRAESTSITGPTGMNVVLTYTGSLQALGHLLNYCAYQDYWTSRGAVSYRDFFGVYINNMTASPRSVCITYPTQTVSIAWSLIGHIFPAPSPVVLPRGRYDNTFFYVNGRVVRGGVWVTQAVGLALAALNSRPWLSTHINVVTGVDNKDIVFANDHWATMLANVNRSLEGPFRAQGGGGHADGAEPPPPPDTTIGP